MCPGVAVPSQACPQSGAKWNDLRLLLFTEYDDIRRYLVEMRRAAIADTDLAEQVVEISAQVVKGQPGVGRKTRP